ncbi:MAG TPA: YoaK family protein [Clostridia bacterium]|nr:YoaK family protein [Clostridia bacterium]
MFYRAPGSDEKSQKRHAIHESVPFGVLLAVVGGFLDAYTFIGRGGVFANAQTGNIVLVGIYVSRGELQKSLGSLVPIFAFVMGVLVAESIKRNASRLWALDCARTVLFFEMTVLFMIGFVPSTVPNYFVTVTVSFVASLQVSTFRKLVDSPYSTTMCTGNLRTAAREAYLAVTQKDRESARRSLRFFIIIFSFFVGAVSGGLLTSAVKEKAVWVAVACLAAAAVLFSIANQNPAGGQKNSAGRPERKNL